METTLINLLLPLVVSLAGIAITAAQGTKWWQRIIAGREERIAGYIEIGIRYAYERFVKHRKAEGGKLSIQEASTARDIALRAAGEEAIRAGDERLLQKLSEGDLNARLEGALQEIKAMAAAGDAARVTARPLPPPNFRGTAQGILFLLALPLFAGCNTFGGATYDRDTDVIAGIPAAILGYEAAAREAWTIWELRGTTGQLDDFDATGMDQDQAREVAFRYCVAVMAYSTTQISSRAPRPGIAETVAEAALITAWYLREAHPHVEISWDDLRFGLLDRGYNAGRLAPLVDY